MPTWWTNRYQTNCNQCPLMTNIFGENNNYANYIWLKKIPTNFFLIRHIFLLDFKAVVSYKLWRNWWKKKHTHTHKEHIETRAENIIKANQLRKNQGINLFKHKNHTNCIRFKYSVACVNGNQKKLGVLKLRWFDGWECEACKLQSVCESIV